MKIKNLDAVGGKKGGVWWRVLIPVQPLQDASQQVGPKREPERALCHSPQQCLRVRNPAVWATSMLRTGLWTVCWTEPTCQAPGRSIWYKPGMAGNGDAAPGRGNEQLCADNSSLVNARTVTWVEDWGAYNSVKSLIWNGKLAQGRLCRAQVWLRYTRPSNTVCVHEKA